MSQDTDCCDDSCPDHAHDDQFCCRGEKNANDHLFSRESNVCACEPTSTSGRMCCLESKQTCCPEGAVDSPKASTINKVQQQRENGSFKYQFVWISAYIQMNCMIYLYIIFVKINY